MNLKKKIVAAMTAAALGVSLTFGSPVASADAGTIIGVGSILIGASQKNAALNKQIRYYDESEKGRLELYDAFKQKYGVSQNTAYKAQLDKIMANLTKGVAAVDPTVKEKPYIYFVSAQSSINAACSMGHVMMVNEGTFNQITNEDEIAAIVGHEMGHGQRSHVAKGNKKTLQKYVIASLAGTAVGGGQLTSIIAGVAFNHSVAHGSRKYETEADLLGFDYMVNTNYNPGACAAVMQKFVELEGKSKRSNLEKIFLPSDHPDSDKRRDAYVKKLFEYSGKHVTAKDGTITVNNKTLIKVAPSDTMSSAERSYFVLGNLAAAYHHGQNKQAATVQGGTVMLGNQPIITPLAGDEDAYTIADRLNDIK